MGYPFRYYGRQPTNWMGGDLGYDFEISFTDTPTPDQKAELARAFTDTFAGGPAQAKDPWLWSQHVASFRIHERWRNAAQSAFAQVARFCARAHRIAAVAQVISWAAQEVGDGGWDGWTTNTQPIPDAGPRYAPARTPPFGRPVDETLPIAASDPTFDSAFAEARKVLHQRIAENARDHALAESTASGLAFAAYDGDTGPLSPRNQLSHPLFGDAPEGMGLLVSQSTEPYATIVDLERFTPQGLLILDYAGRPVRVTGLEPGRFVGPGFGPDGDILVARGEALYHATRSELILQKVWYSDRPIIAVGVVYDGAWLVLTDEKLLLLRRKDNKVSLVRGAACKNARSASVVRDGSLIIVISKTKAVDVFGYTLGKLKKLGRLRGDVGGRIDEREGEVIVFMKGQPLAITGLDAAYEAWATPLHLKAQAKRNSPTKKRKPRVPKVSVTLRALDYEVMRSGHTLYPYEITAEECAPFAGLKDARVYKSRVGQRLVGVDRATRPAMVWWQTTDGLTSAKGPGLAPCVDFSASGGFAVVWQSQNFGALVLDLDAGTAVAAQLGEGPLGSDLLAAVPIDDTQIVTLHNKGLTLWRLDGSEWKDVAKTKLSRCSDGGYCPKLKTFAVLTDTPKARFVLFSIEPERLKKISTFTEPASHLSTIDGAIRISCTDGANYEVVIE